jgi:hypothetical protein
MPDSNMSNVEMPFSFVLSLVGALRRLEWSGQRHGLGTRGDYKAPPQLFPCCPLCGGVKPGLMVDVRFRESDIGHLDSCFFAEALHQIEADI